MGAGVGLYVRLATQLSLNKTFIEFRRYPIFWLVKLHTVLRYRSPITYLVI